MYQCGTTNTTTRITTVFVKLMDSLEGSDSDMKKTFELVECKRAKVVVDTELTDRPIKRVMIDTVGDGANWMGFSMEGNAYFINDHGKTVARISPEI